YIQQNIRADCSNIEKIMEPPEGQDEGTVLFGAEWFGREIAERMPSRHMYPDDRHRAVDFLVRCPQNSQRGILTADMICPAIDYTRHTLDGAACLLNSNKYFPSRIKESSVAKLGSVCRRIYRIFSHAYFHHRQIFDKYENETFLCHRFTRFVMKYNLMSKDNLIVPILEEEVQSATAGESDA
ncbi:hypothetical protein DNTS_026906, partial [Danionella cerebrum]